MLGLLLYIYIFYNFGGIFGAQVIVCGGFFAKIVNGLKLLIAFANGFRFDVSLGYEFAFEFVLTRK